MARVESSGGRATIATRCRRRRLSAAAACLELAAAATPATGAPPQRLGRGAPRAATQRCPSRPSGAASAPGPRAVLGCVHRQPRSSSGAWPRMDAVRCRRGRHVPSRLVAHLARRYQESRRDARRGLLRRARTRRHRGVLRSRCGGQSRRGGGLRVRRTSLCACDAGPDTVSLLLRGRPPMVPASHACVGLLGDDAVVPPCNALVAGSAGAHRLASLVRLDTAIPGAWPQRDGVSLCGSPCPTAATESDR